MKPAYAISSEDGISVTRFFRKPDLAEALRSMDEVRAMEEPRLRLWILEAGVNLQKEELVQIAQRGKEIWPVPSLAAIVAPDSLSYGLSRIYDVYREQEQHRTRVFWTEQEARAWLLEADNLL